MHWELSISDLEYEIVLYVYAILHEYVWVCQWLCMTEFLAYQLSVYLNGLTRDCILLCDSTEFEFVLCVST